MYQSCSYTSCEISPALAEVQRRRVVDAAGHSRRFTVEVRDAAAPAGWGEPRGEHCFLLAMEVLDNCPHDRCAPDEPAADPPPQKPIVRHLQAWCSNGTVCQLSHSKASAQQRTGILQD